MQLIGAQPLDAPAAHSPTRTSLRQIGESAFCGQFFIAERLRRCRRVRVESGICLPTVSGWKVGITLWRAKNILGLLRYVAQVMIHEEDVAAAICRMGLQNSRAFLRSGGLRASILAGQYSERTGAFGALPSEPDWSVPGLRRGDITLPGLLRKLGYRSAALSKCSRSIDARQDLSVISSRTLRPCTVVPPYVRAVARHVALFAPGRGHPRPRYRATSAAGCLASVSRQPAREQFRIPTACPPRCHSSSIGAHA